MRTDPWLVFFHIRNQTGNSAPAGAARNREDKVTLALFDLDNTLLADDSDKLWGEFLEHKRIVDPASHRERNERFHRDYEQGVLDIEAFLRFALQPLADNDPADLDRWRAEFLRDWIEPIIAPAAPALVEYHRDQGHTLVIITATNRFLTEPIAERLGIPYLLATEPEVRAGRFTGDYVGTPTFREGKITVLEHWRRQQGESLEASSFYSDSINDLPLLRAVDHPVVVDPDPQLNEAASRAGWRQLTLRAGPQPQAYRPA